jgi:hypothetical protein
VLLVKHGDWLVDRARLIDGPNGIYNTRIHELES